MNRGDIKLAYDRAIAHDVPDVADRLYEMAERIRALEAHNAVLYAALDAVQQVANNSDGIAGWHLNGDIATWDSILPEVAIALASTPEQSLSSIRRAERERCAVLVENLPCEWSHEERETERCAAAIRQMED